MKYLKPRRREIIRRLRSVRRKEKVKEQDQYLCYHDSGFLMDILEYNGFAVHSLERCAPNYREFRLVVELKADEELFRARLEETLNKLNLSNFKP